ncbi:hypothetical protein E4O86_06755 [Rhizobiales bacterium L72]|uniref:Cytochrome c domain-containing protein n=2 Tax=Propylenella binzhouense TaxID=2555902 RepID=A0A964T337_9HYPH|nr:hypothetical protein [Propylenella binzhouense]
MALALSAGLCVSASSAGVLGGSAQGPGGEAAAGSAVAAAESRSAAAPADRPPQPPASESDEPRPAETELGPVFMLTVGGKLYDDLWVVLGTAAPAGRNPAFPKDVEIDARQTWRCVTCHGWDYRGGEGETSRRIPGANFPSLRALDGENPADVAERIRDAHGLFLVGAVPDLAIDLLAGFLTGGQIDEADFFDERGRSLGEPEVGRDIFEGACINCHQLDGRRFLHGEHGDRSSLGWVVRNRPEQALHKIMNGVPGAEMLALRFMDYWQIADLLAYLQVLDPKER